MLETTAPTVDKDDIARRLAEIAIYLELEGANPFEVNAFRNAADSLRDWDGDLRQAVRDHTLTEIHAIGRGIAAIVSEFVHTGSAQKHQALQSTYPPGILELFEVPGLGLKKVKALYTALGVGSLDELEHAARAGAIRTQRGFGAHSEARIVRGIEWVRARRG